MFRRDDEGAAYTVAALFAGVLFIAAIGAVLVQSNDVTHGSAESIESATAQQEAGNLADLLFRSPGQTSAGATWNGHDDTDGLSRLGLMDENGEHLDYDKFENLRLAKFAADTDGHVNYEEAAAALGLEEAGLDFHIRAYPSLPGVRKILEEGYKDPNLPVAYIGDIGPKEGATGITATPYTCEPSSEDASVVRLSVEVTSASVDETQFHYVFDVTTASGGARVENVGGRLGASGSGTDSETAWADLAAGINCSDITATALEITGPSGTLLEEFDLGAPTTSTDSTALSSQDLALRLGSPYTLSSKDAEIELTGPEGTDLVRITITSGATTHHDTNQVPYEDLASPLKVGSLPTGELTVTAIHEDGTTVQHRLLVVASGDKPPGYNTGSGAAATTGELDQWSEAAKKETEFIERIVQRFCPYYYVDKDTADADPPPTPVAGLTYDDRCTERPSRGQAGDVFPHTWPELQPALQKRLYYPTGHANAGDADISTTGVIIIGSGVNHQGLVHVKSELAGWVAAGGTLIVFGSDDTNTQWMQSIFHLGIHSSSTGLATVHDEGHPSLHTPDDLSYDAYDNGEQFWKFTSGATDEMFTNVIADADETQTILSVSNPGAFGKGSLLVTSWYAYDLDRTGSGDFDREGLKLTNNLIMLGYQTLYLDYGPPLPDGITVTPAISKKAIDHPQLGLVTLDLAVYVFPAS